MCCPPLIAIFAPVKNGFVRGQISAQARRFLRLAQAPDWNLRQDFRVQHILGNGFHHRGADVSRRIVFTVMPFLATSSAKALVKPCMPAFAAE